jgi:hypothetical protein
MNRLNWLVISLTRTLNMNEEVKNMATEQEKSEMAAKMDESAKIAEEAFMQLEETTRKALATFWATHYAGAGHKRLGRMLVAYSKK